MLWLITIVVTIGDCDCGTEVAEAKVRELRAMVGEHRSIASHLQALRVRDTENM